LLTRHPSDLLSTLETTRPLFTSYLRIRSLASAPTSPELAQARAELESNLQGLSTDLQDLVASVRAAEKDPFRYGLDIEEVGRRSRLVEDVGAEVESMRAELVRTVRQQAGGHAAAYAGKALPDPGQFEDDDGGGDAYAALEQQRQVEIMAEQDEALDGVFQTVGNLREQAHVMGRELEEQGGMLDEVDGIADRVGGKLKGGMGRLNGIIRKNEGEFGRGWLAVQLAKEANEGCRYREQLLYCHPDLRAAIIADIAYCALSDRRFGCGEFINEARIYSMPNNILCQGRIHQEVRFV
jgi:t-SNARE syntaxin family protein